MKKLSVASMNRFASALSTFPNYNVLSVDAVNRIMKAFQNEKVCTLATSCIKMDYDVAFSNWKEKVAKAEKALVLLKDIKADKKTIEKAEGTLQKLLNSSPVLNTEKYYVFGYILQNFFGVSANTIVPLNAWKKAYILRSMLYSPLDYGAEGKQAEVRDRLEVYTVNGQKKTNWAQFSAHKSGQKDITDKVEGVHYEKKTSVGDWYTSKRAKTLDAIRRELERKDSTLLRWDYEKQIIKPASKRKPERIVTISIHWEKNYTEFFKILEGFNGDIATWFKPIKETENGYLLQMQEIQTSEKKIAYLMQFNDK